MLLIVTIFNYSVSQIIIIKIKEISEQNRVMLNAMATGWCLNRKPASDREKMYARSFSIKRSQ